MTTSARAVGSFPSPFEISTPPGCEGWEEMYPHYALFAEERREPDEARLWFWNSMHFPVPMPAFDITSTDGPYYALANWQNRAFAVPPAMGIDYRVVNSYVYISVNGVTDPAKIAERAEYSRSARATTPELGRAVREVEDEDGGAPRRTQALEVADLPEYEPEMSSFGDEDLRFSKVLDGYRRCLRPVERMWQHHFEFLLLGYGAYLTFSDFCKAALPDIPDQHIAQMVAGIDVIMFRPDEELRRLARLAVDTGRRLGVRRRAPAGRDRSRSSRRATRGGRGSRSSRRSRSRGSTWAPATACTTTSARWLDDPTIPYASIGGLHLGAAAGDATSSARPRSSPASATACAEGYAEVLAEDQRGPYQELLMLVAHGVPVRRGAQVLLRLLVH